MALTPGEADRLLLFTQAQLARARRERGLRLNVPEATAYIADAVCEWARDGLSLTQARDQARTLLTVDDVLSDVPEVLVEVRVEARFDDGTRLIVVRDPFCVGLADESVDHRVTGTSMTMRNEASTPIGVTSHIHLAEVNPRLRLNRDAAFGMRLDIPTGTTLWISPGETVETHLVPIGGERVVEGNTGVVDGPLDDPAVRDRALARLRECGYLDVVDGQPVNAAADAETAVARLMDGRRS
ncbi:MAG: urease subunit gamma [Actinobacteria bacterium]|nr:urease subunit gamma [Actinomycetota bacterium]